MKIQHVDVNYVNQIWPQVEKFIAAALAYQDDYTIEHVKVYVTNSTWTLIVAVDEAGEIHGAATVQFYNRPNDRVAFVVTIGGRLITNPDTFHQLSNLLKAFGATAIEGSARESIARMWKRYGFEEKYRVVGAKL
jgi:hypothetical protein